MFPSDVGLIVLAILAMLGLLSAMAVAVFGAATIRAKIRHELGYFKRWLRNKRKPARPQRIYTIRSDK
jgi:uncharacterized membrane protein YecN with MAPEG domain